MAATKLPEGSASTRFVPTSTPGAPPTPDAARPREAAAGTSPTSEQAVQAPADWDKRYTGAKADQATRTAMAAPKSELQRGGKAQDPAVTALIAAQLGPHLARALANGRRIPITSGAQRATIVPTTQGFRIEAFTAGAKRPTSIAELFFTKEGKLVGTGEYSKAVSDTLASLGKPTPDGWYFRTAAELDHFDAAQVRELKKYFALSQGGKNPAGYAAGKTKLYFASAELQAIHEAHSRHFLGLDKSSTVGDSWGGKALHETLFSREVVTDGPELAGGRRLAQMKVPAPGRPHATMAPSAIEADSVMARTLVGDAAAGSDAALSTSAVYELRSADGSVRRLGYELGPEVYTNVDTFAVSHAHGDHFDLAAFRHRVAEMKLPTTIVCTAEVEADIRVQFGGKLPDNVRFVRSQVLGDYVITSKPNPATSHGPATGRTSIERLGQKMALVTGDGDFNPASIDKRLASFDEQARALAGDASPAAKRRLSDLHDEVRRLKELRTDLAAPYHDLLVDEGTNGFDTHGSAETVSNLQRDAAARGQSAGRYQRTHNQGYGPDESKRFNLKEGEQTQWKSNGSVVRRALKLEKDLVASGFKVVTGQEAQQLLAAHKAVEFRYGDSVVVVRPNDAAMRRLAERYTFGDGVNKTFDKLLVNGKPASSALSLKPQAARSSPVLKVGKFEITSEVPPWLADKLKSAKFRAAFGTFLTQNPKVAKALGTTGKLAGPVLIALFAAKEIYDNREGLQRGDPEAVKNVTDFAMQIPESVVTGLPDLVFTVSYGATRYVINLGDWKKTVSETSQVSMPLTTLASKFNRWLLDHAL